MANTLNIKRGDTFKYSVSVIDSNKQPIDLTGWTISSQIKNFDELIADVIISSDDFSTGNYYLSVEDTSYFPIEKLECDIEYTSTDGTIMSTETFYINVIKDITNVNSY